MSQGIDHVVIGVRDLARAAADYAALGFTVTPGGEHAGGATHNALVSFADGTYLELIAFTEPDRPQGHRWWKTLADGEGLIDVALRSDDLRTVAGRLARAGMGGDEPQAGGRVRPDGTEIGWRNLVLDRAGVWLPFVIEDVTARELRVPGGSATEHPLGVAGVAGLTIAVADLDASAAAFAALLDTPGALIHGGAGVRQARRFAIGPHWLELVVPDDTGGDLAEQMTRRGEGPFALTLRAPSGPETTLPLDQTHAARIRVAP